MADDPNTESVEVEDKGISEEELRGIFASEVKKELDERGLTAEVVEGLGGIGDFVKGLFEENKPTADNSEGLLEKIGTMIDDKLKGLGGGGENGKPKEPRKPKLNVFGGGS